MWRPLILALVVCFWVPSGQGASAADEPYYSKELGLTLKLIRARHLYHGKNVFFPALQIVEVSGTSVLNSAMLLDTGSIDEVWASPGLANDKLRQGNVLPARAGDILILHNFVDMGDLDNGNAERRGKEFPELISGRYYVDKATAGGFILESTLKEAVAQLPFFRVKTAADYLKFALTPRSRFRYRQELPFFRFRLARPISPGTPYHFSTAVKYTDPDGPDDNLQGPALLLPVPPNRASRLSHPVFETSNPFCEQQFPLLFKEQAGNRCKSARREVASSPGPAESVNPIVAGFWATVIAGVLLGGNGPKVGEEFVENGRKCRYRVGRHSESTNYLGGAGCHPCEYEFVYKQCD